MIKVRELRAFETDLNPNGITPEELVRKGTILYDFSHLKPSPTNDTHAFQSSEFEYLKDPEFISKINHSCDPNIILDVKKMACIAIKDIHPGEIISYFYPSTEWEMVSPFKCLCGAQQCIGTIQGAKFMTKDQLSRYFINDFLLEMREHL